MKRLVTLMLVVAFTFSMAAQASAIEINVKGNFHFAFRWADNFGGTKFQNTEEETFNARQRVRLQVEFIASENLKGVLFLHSGFINWGENGDARDGGGQLDTNSSSMKTRFAYIDWNVADTNLNLKIGLQDVVSPGFAGGATFVHDAMAGITVSNRFNDNFTGTIGWYRLSDGESSTGKPIKDRFDMFMLMLPMTFDSFKVTPWGEFSMIGRDAVLRDGYNVGGTTFLMGNEFEKKAKMWHAGITAEINPIDPLKIMADFTYGGVSAGGDSIETGGYMAVLKATYDIGFGKLAAGAWYASGNDRDDLKDRDYNNMPSLLGTTHGDPGFNFSSLGFWGNQPLAGATQVSSSGVGTWGVLLGLEDFSFVADLSHTFRALWYTGTNDKDLRDSNGSWFSGIDSKGRTYGASGVGGTGGLFLCNSGVLMTEKDNAFEFNLDSKYQIAKGFTATLDMGIVFMDWQSKYENYYDLDDTMWRINLGFQYAF